MDGAIFSHALSGGFEPRSIWQGRDDRGNLSSDTTEPKLPEGFGDAVRYQPKNSR
ncbi:hypothetical protein CEV31_4156 [Brucella thiophenivorans]|uniref:Uncharacterized protein n=1 Tax=Brucella thiophenivorans TaxID=571255 RepID=A0A256EXW2_9HYPH|nr:hypothetical protein CEV31_4156 [Brucella thiophenivorans]